jgi:spore coat polysaccharide biosynthesis predicted glycosyltransferase SpsG
MISFGLFFDDSFDLGLGHISRLIGIAQELQSRGLGYCFHGNGEMKISSSEFIDSFGLNSNCRCNRKVDVGIIDTYNSEYRVDFSTSMIRVLLIDETSPRSLADAYVIASPILSWIPPVGGGQILQFQNSPIMRKEIMLAALNSERAKGSNGMLVIFGGICIDEFKRILIEFGTAMSEIWPELRMSVVCYSSEQIEFANRLNFHPVHPTKNLISLTSEFSVIISSGGVIAWELAALNIPGFSIAVIDNQEFQVKYLRENSIRDGVSASSLEFSDLVRSEIIKLKENLAEPKIRPDLDGSRNVVNFVLESFNLQTY